MSTNVGEYTGKPVSRVDGRAKVTGTARYAAEFPAAKLLHGVIVSSEISKGQITAIDAREALALPGVFHVFTHENAPKTASRDAKWRDQVAPGGSPFRPLRDDKILFAMQPVALVVADSFALARHAARLVRITYESQPHRTDLTASVSEARPAKTGGFYEAPPKTKGDPDSALAAAAVRVDAEYTHPCEYHHPMELFATTVVLDDDGVLTVHDKTQGVLNTQTYVCNVFGLAPEKVRVINPFVGGAFGSGLRPQYQLVLAVMAAVALKRSVRVEMTRPQMFTHGYRPATLQKISLGADRAGKLVALKHEAIAQTSMFEDYAEVIVNWSAQNYPCDNVALAHKLVSLDMSTPAPMRAPGAATGCWAIETAMDELSYAVGIDPVELRLLNYSEKDPVSGKPFSSKELKTCLRQGGERFGWSRRDPKPRSMRDGDWLVGQGVAVGVWDALFAPATARATLGLDGRLLVASATSDIGTCTYTAMTIVAADALGLPLERVTFKLGDTSLPMSPIQGGSWTMASVGTAVKLACDAIAAKLLKFARKLPDSPLASARPEDVRFAGGQISLKSDPAKAVSFVDAMRGAGVLSIEETGASAPGRERAGYTMSTHSAVFIEVKFDESVGTLVVSRAVSAVAAGRIINAKAARSQILGAVVGGISMALHEEAIIDSRLGRIINHDLAEYHVSVNADVPHIDVHFVEEHDEHVNPLGVKGVGEIGICGVAAAISNAVYHATGRRVRSLPITRDKLL